MKLLYDRTRLNHVQSFDTHNPQKPLGALRKLKKPQGNLWNP